MVTDSQFYNLPESFDDFTFINEAPTPSPATPSNFDYGLEIQDASFSRNMLNDVFPPGPDCSAGVQSLNESPHIECVDDHAFDSAFELLNHVLMEESIDEKASVFNDPLALQTTEKSFYEVIGRKYTNTDLNIECPNSLSKRSCVTDGDSVYPSLSGDPGFHSSDQSVQSPFASSQPLVHLVNSSPSISDGEINSSLNMNLIPSQFSDMDFKLQFWKGMEEARKFLPTNNELVIDLDKNALAPKPVKDPPKVLVIVEKDYSTSSRGRKHLYLHDSDLDERSSKQSTVYEDEVELSKMFDNLFLRDFKGVILSSKGDVTYPNGFDKFWQHNRLPRVPRYPKAPKVNQGLGSDVLKLQSLLVNCARAVASNDLPDAHEQLEKIKQYVSSTGHACQKMAEVFVNGLEARLAGTGAEMYAALASKKISFCEMLKSYQVYASTCPFVFNSRANGNKNILKIAAKGSNLHIIDFGISCGFQWPVLIQLLAIRRGGPPKLRITGVDFPQPGFRPTKLIEETGQRLAEYCKRFNVPFEYQAMARHSWETIDINDLNLVRDEVLVVNCFERFQDLPVAIPEESPKDGILKLIRSMKPDLFLHSIVNGSYNAPFFLTRFQEALFHYTSLFDMFDVTLPQNDLQRLHFEKEFESEVLNIIACEGKQRVLRPETYKQWQIRSRQAGFKIVPMEKEIGLKHEVKTHYHKDFLYDEDGEWMLQGWKGRVLYASSCWVPV